MPEADEEAPRDMMDVRPDESTLPTAGNRIWGNCTGVRIGIGIEVIGRSNKRSPTSNVVNQSVTLCFNSTTTKNMFMFFVL